MKRDIYYFVQEGLLAKMPFVQKLAPRLIEKAKNNLITLSILFDLHNDKEVRASLNVPEDYDSSEWVVVCAYYAMYMAALAPLVKLGYQSKNHTATVFALETFFVKKQLLEEDYLDMIEKAQLEKEYLDTLNLARNKREMAQYSITKETTRRLAEEIKEEAYKFVERMEKLVADLSRPDQER